MKDETKSNAQVLEELAEVRHSVTTMESGELRMTRGYLENVLENSPDGIGIVDRHGILIKWNKMAAELYGYSFEELKGKKAFDLYADRQELQKMLSLLRRDGSVKKYEIEMKKKDGSIAPFELSIGLLRDINNSLIGSVCVSRDLNEVKKSLAALRAANEALHQEISERRRTEEELKQIRDCLENVFENSPDAIGIVDRHGRLIKWNRRAAELYGYSFEELRGKKAFNLYADQDELNDMLVQLRQDGTAKNCEIKMKHKNGGIIPFELSISLLKDDEKNTIGSVCVARNLSDAQKTMLLLREANERLNLEIAERQQAEEALQQAYQEIELKVAERTRELRAANSRLTGEIEERRRIEEALRKSEEAFKNLVLNAPIGLFIAQQSRFRQINREFLKITGYEEEELLNNDCLCLIIPEFREKVREKAVKILRGESHLPFEFQYLNKAGEVRWALEKVAPTQYEGERATLGYFMDITASKHLEAQLLQAQKMEAVGRLAGGVAHDFNNLLTGIMGYGELMLLALPDEDPNRRHTEEIIKATERAAALTRQLLAFGRKQIVKSSIINLNRIISSMEKMLRRVLGEDLTLITLLDPALGAVKVDPGQMDQVIMNLAVNARDAMPQGGVLTLETENIYVDEAYTWDHLGVTPGSYVMVSVSDTGIGMDAAIRDHIFEPFFTTKEAGKGTGLGLATVYGIITQNSGYIWVYSEPGHGTTFKILLPRVHEEPAPLRPAAPSALSLKGQETILVVEDDERLREVVCRTLSSYGYQVLEAGHGSEALRLCGRHPGPIHLVLTDVVMPRMSGGELIERLAPLGRRVKVLFMSGYSEDTASLRNLLAAGAPFLEKPFKMIDLARKVREVLDSP